MRDTPMEVVVSGIIFSYLNNPQCSPTDLRDCVIDKHSYIHTWAIVCKSGFTI